MRNLEHQLDEEHLIPKSHRQAIPKSDYSRILKWCLCTRFSVNTLGLAMIVVMNFIYCVLVFRMAHWTSHSVPLEDETWEYYSPVLKSIKLPFRTKQVDARLFPNISEPMGVFAAPPSPEVDHAWMRISRNMIFGITERDVLRLHKDPEDAVKFNPEWEVVGGEDLYLGVLDVFHQVHCLNMLRQNLITNYDYYWGDIYGFKPPVFRETHLWHCTSILLQAIMCHSDIGVVTHIWSEDRSVPTPDFGINRKCRDFEALLKWRDETDLDGSFTKFKDYRAPQGAPVMPGDPHLADLYANADEYKDGEYLKQLHIKGCNE